jgi:hypothetical protein
MQELHMGHIAICRICKICCNMSQYTNIFCHILRIVLHIFCHNLHISFHILHIFVILCIFPFKSCIFACIFAY